MEIDKCLLCKCGTCSNNCQNCFGCINASDPDEDCIDLFLSECDSYDS